MTQAPLVSVVIPAYNLARFLPAAIDSALGQDWPQDSLELIVVDDGSTDETQQVLAGYGERIRTVRQQNGGLVAAVDRGLHEVRGDYVALLDADDEWPADRISRHVAALQARPEAGLVHGDMELIDEHGNTTHRSFFEAYNKDVREGRVLGALLAGNFVSGGACTFRASLLPVLLPIDPAAAYPDWWIAANIAAVAEIVTVPGCANRYRDHDSNMGLGTGAAGLDRALVREVPWRQWMLRNLTRTPGLTADDLRGAVVSWRYSLQHALNVTGAQPGELYPVAGAARAQAASLLAQAAADAPGDPLGALALVAAALGEDPWSAEALSLVDPLHQRAAAAVAAAPVIGVAGAADPVVSILIATYNHERYIGAAIESALAQAADYPAELLDIVVVNDGSTDGTRAVCDRYRDRVRLVHKENGGLLSTVNRLLSEARGELLGWLSGDDRIGRGAIARRARALIDRPWATLVYSDARHIDAAGATLDGSYYSRNHTLPRPVGDARGPLLERNCICAPTTMWRASLLPRIAPIGPPAVWEDWWMYIRAAEAGEVAYLSELDVDYRIHGANMSAGISDDEQIRFCARELPFRHWLLTEAELGGVGHVDVASAMRAYLWHLGRAVSAGLGEAMELAPFDAARATELLAEAARSVDPVPAAVLAAQAVAWNPVDAAIRSTAGTLIAAADLAHPPAVTRSAVVVAEAGELVRVPGLLAAYVAATTAASDQTLVIDVKGWTTERIEQQLLPVAAAAGLAADASADATLAGDARSWPDRLAAVLTLDPGTAAAYGAPMIGAGSGQLSAGMELRAA